VQERSKFDEGVWQSPLSNREHPTPYSYLLYEISRDLHDLSANALQSATTSGEPPRAEAPGRVARDLARAWSACISNIADSQSAVSLEFRNNVIEEYLLFVLALGWEPGEIYFGSGRNDVEGLDPWRDLFLSELQSHFASGNPRETDALRDTFESLDQGKLFVSEGYDWLEDKLFGKRSG